MAPASSPSATLPNKLWMSSDLDNERIRIAAEDKGDFHLSPQAGMQERALTGEVCYGGYHSGKGPAT